jgi:molybdopterin-containing oxidoreductase family iron-sulfur binding subunit
MPPLKPKLDGATMQDTPSSFALPVVSDKAEAAPAQAPDAVSEALDHASSKAVAAEGAYGKTYWRSLEEKLGQPEYLETTRPEFPEGADLPPSGVARREFMQLLGASMALAGATACSTRPVDERMVAYTRTPPELTPGNALHYASGMTFAGHTSGLLITAREGRPIKVEGNPQHPINQGAAGPWEQSFLMSLYDPKRARVLRQRKESRALRVFGEQVAVLTNKSAAADGGARIRFLTEPLNSPLLQDVRTRLQQRLPNAKFYSYTTATQDPVSEGTRTLFGQAATPRYDFSLADVIVSLDADFLESRPSNLAYARAFAKRRDPAEGGELSRLYVAEPRYSLTGGMADHRLRAKSQDIYALAAAIAARIGGPLASLAATATAKARLPAAYEKWVEVVAADLQGHSGRCLVIAGERQPAAVHALAAAINAALNNTGSTVHYLPATTPEASGPAALRPLVEELKAGAVDTLVITAWNPLYSLPADLGLRELLDLKAPNRDKLNVVYTSLFEDETSAHADWFIPAAHELEGWGDGRALDGTVSIVQPLTQPIFNGVPLVEMLALFLGEGTYRTSYQLLQESWRTRSATLTDFETAWETWVSVGVVPNTTATALAQAPDYAAAAAVVNAYTPPAPLGDKELEVNFITDYSVFDGRFGNISWLQELPDPISKITWDNAAYLSPKTAEKWGLQPGDVAELQYGQPKEGQAPLKVPVWVLPGTADDVVVLPLGYGRTGQPMRGGAEQDVVDRALGVTLHEGGDTEGESIAHGKGFNANLVRRADAPWFDSGAKLVKTRETHKFALTQSHWRMEGRPIALDMPVEDFRKEYEKHRTGKYTELNRVKGPVANLMPDYEYTEYKWAMAIDLGRCTGCAACVVACQAENNIPVVGKAQVARSREMQWLRIDRYFSGDEVTDPELVFQPLMCVHCEKAPCEYVCPVNATVHSDEGLNDMVYNRCVGTRYCSNNCPYKVRRFNYLHYNKGKSPTEKMLMNPDVTVRARGVMEKCTYCVQRIERVRIHARVEQRPIQEKELMTACQQTCPTDAIVFGTLSDPNARVTQLHNDERAYRLLLELGTQPRTAHLVRLRNPNKALVAEKPKQEAEH